VQSFETLIPADSYNLYGEIRGVGQLIRSNAMNEILDPILKLSGPAKELTATVKWLNAHADEMMTSRLLVASWPSAKGVPETLVAIEFASAEEAAKFAKPLHEHLVTLLPPTPDEESAIDGNKQAAGQNSKSPTPAPTPGSLKPAFHMQQSGSLILLTPTPLNLRKFKPAGSKLLADEINFRTARNRFNSEPVFVFVAMESIEREEAEQQKKYEATIAEEQKKATARQEEMKTQQVIDAELAAQERAILEAEEFQRVSPGLPGDSNRGVAVGGEEMTGQQPPPDPASVVVGLLTSSFFSGESKWPQAVALALSLEGESYDLRALLLNQPGVKSDAVPFMPLLIPGEPFLPESPNVLPADTELLLTMSLDLPQVYSSMAKPRANMPFVVANTRTNPNGLEFDSPLSALEKKLQLSLRDDVLPLFGPEVAIRLPITDFGIFGLGRTPGSQPAEGKSSANAAPVLVLAMRDKEGVRALMPKLVEGMGFKGAASFAQTERQDDTEIVSYAGFFSYAFVADFLVLSSDPATTRHVVDSYLKRETLAGDVQFKNFTRWQPRPTHGQIFISSALMESYKSWVQQPNTRISEDTRAFLTRMTEVCQPITYSLSNEGLGPLHELRLPRNLVLMAVAGISGETNPPPDLVNERRAMSSLHSIAYAQSRYKEEKGKATYGTLEQLLAEHMISPNSLEGFGYRLDLMVTGEKFELTATPLEYRKSGMFSYFIDETFVLRGGDKNGAAATSSDPPI
jgi:hypothetical protein